MRGSLKRDARFPLVEGPTSVNERVMEESILHLNSHDLLVREKGGDTMCEPDPIGNVVRVLFGKEAVMDSNSLCSEKKDGLDRGYSMGYKPDDGGEVSSTKGREWQGHRVQRLVGGIIHL
ncbi:hypothetical protein ACOSQ2_011170 [Xanthoceras sorbifolium]